MKLSKWIEETEKALTLECESEGFPTTNIPEGDSNACTSKEGNYLEKLRLEGREELLGQHLITFCLTAGASENIPLFSHGTTVELLENESQHTDATSAMGITGVVSNIHLPLITVSFRAATLFRLSGVLNKNVLFKLHKLPNTASQNVLFDTLSKLKSREYEHPIFNIIFDNALNNQDEGSMKDFLAFNSLLNETQVRSVKFALEAKDICLIHGPPGTGKTTAVVEIIKQAVLCSNMRVLVCAASNVAVDNILFKLCLDIESEHLDERTGGRKINLTRVGHPARIAKEVSRFSLESAAYKAKENQGILNKRLEINAALNELNSNVEMLNCATDNNQAKLGVPNSSYKKKKSELNKLWKKLMIEENAIINSILRSVDVVFSTNIGSQQLLRSFGKLKEKGCKYPFDILIIDEAAQALEISCYVPLQFCRKMILVGDPKQLPPTIKFLGKERIVLEQTLFDKLFCCYGDKVTTMLKVQYRMNKIINQWPSDEFYSSELVSHDSAALRTIKSLKCGTSTKDSSIFDEVFDNLAGPLVLIDTSFQGYTEVQKTGNDKQANSHYNVQESEIVLMQCKFLLQQGLLPVEIGVITPYRAQVEVIQVLFNEAQHSASYTFGSAFNFSEIEVSSIDGFQGREKAAVVISLVRSNENGTIGFLNDERRLNVAITRAKYHLCLICDTETISSHGSSNRNRGLLRRLIEYFKSFGKAYSADTYISHVKPANKLALGNNSNNFVLAKGEGGYREGKFSLSMAEEIFLASIDTFCYVAGVFSSDDLLVYVDDGIELSSDDFLLVESSLALKSNEAELSSDFEYIERYCNFLKDNGNSLVYSIVQKKRISILYLFRNATDKELYLKLRSKFLTYKLMKSGKSPEHARQQVLQDIKRFEQLS